MESVWRRELTSAKETMGHKKFSLLKDSLLTSGQTSRSQVERPHPVHLRAKPARAYPNNFDQFLWLAPTLFLEE